MVLDGSYRQPTEGNKKKEKLLESKQTPPADWSRAEWKCTLGEHFSAASTRSLIARLLRINKTACRQGQMGLYRRNTSTAPTLPLQLGPCDPRWLGDRGTVNYE